MSIKLHVWGDFACFTRPEMKAERVSYDVITPSAARGVLEAIYWKPQFRWVIDKIHVLKPIHFTSIRRNEVGKKATTPNKKVMAGEKPASPILIEDERQQRASLILRDVSYLIEAHIEILGYRFERNGPELSESQCLGKHLGTFERKAGKGQYFHHPYLGTREFPANFELIESSEQLPTSQLTDHEKDRDFGFMLYDLEYEQDPRTKKVKDTTARFYPAKMKNGIIDVRNCLANSPLNH